VACLVHLVYLVCFVYLVDLVHLVSFVQPKNETNTTNQTNKTDAFKRLADFFSIPLMFQFVSHSAQEMRHAKGLLEGLSCPEKFRDIQDILSPSCA